MPFLRSVDAISVAKYGLVFGAILGFAAAVVFESSGGVQATAMPASQTVQVVSTLMAYYGALGLVIVPVLGALLVSLCLAITAWLYNWTSPRVGAVGIDLKKGRLNNIEAFSLAKMYAVLAAGFGFAFSCISVAFVTLLAAEASPAMYLQIAASWVPAIPVITILAAVVGLVGGLVFALLYDMIAGGVGGVRLDIKKGELRSVGVISYIKVMAVFGVIYGLVAALPWVKYWLTSGVLSFSGLAQPVISLVLYAICAGIVGLLYNFLAGTIGGVKLEIV